MDITLLIGTCDEYSMLWDNLVTLTDRYWSPKCDKIVVSENKNFEYKGYKSITPGNGDWSNRMLKGLDEVDTTYTFFILEDYYFTESITSEDINIHMEFLKEVTGNKVMLESHNARGHIQLDYGIDGLGRKITKLSKHSDYLTSIQPSIWKTGHLKNCMQENWSPWEFEIKGTNLIKGKEDSTYIIQRPKKPYWNAVRKGRTMSPGWEDIKQREQLEEMNLNGQ